MLTIHEKAKSDMGRMILCFIFVTSPFIVSVSDGEVTEKDTKKRMISPFFPVTHSHRVTLRSILYPLTSIFIP